MLPAVRRIAVAEAVFACLLLMVLSAEVVPLFGWLFNPHSTVGGVALSALFLVAAVLFLLLLLSLPIAITTLVRSPTHRTPTQVATVLLGLALVLLLGAWLASLFIQRL
jgi:hypothetical protein